MKLKQVIEFRDVDALNMWLSDRANEKYETKILTVPRSANADAVIYSVIYWGVENDN